MTDLMQLGGKKGRLDPNIDTPSIHVSGHEIGRERTRINLFGKDQVLCILCVPSWMHSGCRCSAIPARNDTQTWRMTLYTNASSSQNTSTSCIENSVVLRRLEFSSQLSETKLRDTCVKICSSMLKFTSTEFFLSYFSSHTPDCVHQAFAKPSTL